MKSPSHVEGPGDTAVLDISNLCHFFLCWKLCLCDILQQEPWVCCVPRHNSDDSANLAAGCYGLRESFTPSGRQSPQLIMGVLSPWIPCFSKKLPHTRCQLFLGIRLVPLVILYSDPGRGWATCLLTTPQGLKAGNGSLCHVPSTHQCLYEWMMAQSFPPAFRLFKGDTAHCLVKDDASEGEMWCLLISLPSCSLGLLFKCVSDHKHRLAQLWLSKSISPMSLQWVKAGEFKMQN